MLKTLSDLKLTNRMDFEAAAGVIASGVTGTFVTLDSSQVLQLPSGATKLAWPVWNESYRDGSVGKWSPDVTETGKLTVIDGYLRAITDQVTGYAGLAVGDLLTVDTSGNLAVTTDGTEDIAVVMRKIDSMTYLGTAFTNLIEFTTK